MPHTENGFSLALIHLSHIMLSYTLHIILFYNCHHRLSLYHLHHQHKNRNQTSLVEKITQELAKIMQLQNHYKSDTQFLPT